MEARLDAQALTPYMNGAIAEKELVEKGSKPIRDFMLAQTRESDLGSVTPGEYLVGELSGPPGRVVMTGVDGSVVQKGQPLFKIAT